MTLKKNKKNGDKDGKALYKLMNNNVYEKTMENVRNRIDVKLVSYKKKTILNGHPNQAICHKKYLTMIWWKFLKKKLYSRLTNLHTLDCVYKN